MRLWSWSLSRSPLAPSVPLDGSETVAGLRILERMRLTEALEGPAGSGAAGAGGGRQRRAFVRYKGPFIEQLVAEDLRADPKPWRTFWQGECGEWQQAYNLPANTDVLRERVEENFVTFLPNYLRLGVAVLLATFYLRPKALLGAAAVAYSMWRAVSSAYRRQQATAEAAAAQQQGAGQQQQRATQGRGRPGATAAGRGGDANEQLSAGLATIVTWVLVAYTRCLPVLLLGAALVLLATLLHTCLRRGPSEHRYSGRQPLGFTLQQVVAGTPVAPPGADPRLLFRQLWRGAVAGARYRLAWAARWLQLWANEWSYALRQRLGSLKPSRSRR